MEDIQNHPGIAVSQHDVAADGHTLAIGRRRRQLALHIHGHGVDLCFQRRRKCGPQNQLSLQPGWQPVSFRKARREVSVVRGIPTTHLAAIVIGEAIATPVILIVVISALIPPVAVIVITIPLLGKRSRCGTYNRNRHNPSEPFSGFHKILL